MREISITNRHPRLRLDRRAIAKAVARLDEHFRFTAADLPTLTPAARRRAKAAACAAPDGELSITFLTDPALAQLHADYLDDPTTTDVITFEGDESMGHAGDVCVSVDTALSYSKNHNISFAEELLRYVIHGWLHLAGFDDLEPRKKRRMRAAEERALKLLRAAGLSPAFSLKPRSRSPAPARTASVAQSSVAPSR